MISKLNFHLSTSLKNLPKWVTSRTKADLSLLKNHFEKASIQLKNSYTYLSAINNFKSGVSVSTELYPEDHLEQSYWISIAALQLAEKSLFRESEGFLRRGVHLLDQISSKTESLKMLQVCFTIGETYQLLNNFNKGEEFYMKCFRIVDSVQPEFKLKILEKLIVTKLTLKNDKEVVLLGKDALVLFESSLENYDEFIKIFTCYEKSLILLNQLENAKKMINRVIQLMSSKQNGKSFNSFIIHAYNLLVDAHVKNESEDEALQAVLEGGKIIEKYLDDIIAVYFYKKMCETFEFKYIAEPIIKAILELSEKNLNDYSEIIQVYKNTFQFYLANENYEKSLEFSNKGLAVARKWNNPVTVLESYMQLAEIHLKIDPENAKGYIELGKSLLDSYPNKEHERSLEYLHFQYHAINMDYQNASSSLENCISLIPPTLENHLVLINLHLDLGTLHKMNFRIEKSLESFKKALKYTDTYYPLITLKRSEILSEISSIYVAEGELEKGLEYLTEALEIEEKMKVENLTLLIMIHTRIMECYSKMNQINLALGTGGEMLKKMKDKNIEANEILGLFYFAFGQVHQKMASKEKAISYYKKAREIFQKLDIDDQVEITEKQLRHCDNEIS